MTTLPHVPPRTRLTVLTPERACLMVDFYLRNRAHLVPLGAQAGRASTPCAHWQTRLRDGCSHYFEAVPCNWWRSIPGGAGARHLQFHTNIVMGMFKACHLGYAIDKEHEGQGLMQEVVAAGIDHLFRERGLHRIMASYMPANLRRRAPRTAGVRGRRIRSGLSDDQRPLGDHVLTALINPLASRAVVEGGLAGDRHRFFTARSHICTPLIPLGIKACKIAP